MEEERASSEQSHGAIWHNTDQVHAQPQNDQQHLLTATVSVNDWTRICATRSNISYWWSRGAGTAEAFVTCLTNSTLMAEAMYVLNRWLESPRSLGNSSLRERDEDSFTAAGRVKIGTIKPVSREILWCSTLFKSRLRSYSEKKPNRKVSCQQQKESPKTDLNSPTK